MTLYNIGRVCVKTVGRETGSYCVIVDEMEGRFVVVTGPKHVSSVRRRKCNIRHLEPLEMEIPIEKGADDSAVEKALEDAGLKEKFKEKIRLPQ
ncbi:MAG: 50S ribosomal protein L14e [Candidatus Thorarchaeota archaeon SMTZ1-83]|nr:MAG: 50S ribosomal protein L14e [Candidatus Thorarchaeota archaeon SMTZ1-83]